jgi:hypothetical protein
MEKKMNRWSITTTSLTAIVLLLSLAACGGGGGGGEGGGSKPVAQQQAVVGMTLTGGSGTVGSVYLELELPDGFTLKTDAQGNLSEGVLITNQPDTYMESVYLPEGNVNYGLLRMASIRSNGFLTQKFCTLFHDLATNEVLPSREEFVVKTLTVTNLNGVRLSGYDVAISVQKQEVSQ